MGPYHYWLSADCRYQALMQDRNEANVAAMAQRMASARRLVGAGMAAIAAPLLWVARRRREAATLRQLAALDDRLLSDIGLTRAAIRDAARRPQLYRPPPAVQPGAHIVVLAPQPAPANSGSCCPEAAGHRSAA